MKKLFIFGVASLLIIFGALVCIVQTPKLMAQIVKELVNTNQDDFVIKNLAFEDSGFLSDKTGVYRIQNMTADVYLKGDSNGIDLSARQILVKDIFSAAIKGKALEGAVEGLDISNKEMSLFQADFNVKIHIRNLQTFNAILSAKKFQWQDYELGNISSTLEISSEQIAFKDFYCDFYDGVLNGKIVLETQNPLTYHMEIFLEDVDAVKLKEAQAVFDNIRGRLSGVMLIQGTPDAIESISGSVKAKEGGEVKAVLLQPILQYVPMPEQKKQLEAIIAKGGRIPLEVAKVDLSSIENDKITMHFILKSREYNLDLNLTIQLNVEGGLMGLLDVQKNIF